MDNHVTSRLTYGSSQWWVVDAVSQGDAWLGSKRVGCELVTGSPVKRETSSNGVGSIFWFSYWCIFNIGNGALCSITSGGPGPTDFW